MANTLIDVAPKILATALTTLRENAVMPRLVNADYSSEAAEQGQSIQVPVPTAMSVQDVVPGAYAQSSPDLQIDTVNIPLDNWKESTFRLTEKDVYEIMDGVVNMQVAEAARALANELDKTLITLYKKVYNTVGTAGTTPFASDPAAAIAARKVLGVNLAPPSQRRIVLNPDAEANAVGLQAFQYYQNSGSTATMQEGEIGRKFGFDWYMDQNLLRYGTHTKGTISGTIVTTGAPVSTTTADASNPQLHNPRTVNTIAVSGATTGQTVKIGDVFTVAGDTQQYVVTNDLTFASTAGTIAFSPAPKVVWSTGAQLTFVASRAINLAFHRDAIALAVRPLKESPFEGELQGNRFVMSMVDDITGIPLRLEVRSEYKQVRYALDCLWGVQMIRPENCVVIAG